MPNNISAPYSQRTYDLSTPEGMAEYKRLNPTAYISADPTYFQTHSLEDGIREKRVNPLAGHAAMAGLYRAGGR